MGLKFLNLKGPQRNIYVVYSQAKEIETYTQSSCGSGHHFRNKICSNFYASITKTSWIEMVSWGLHFPPLTSGTFPHRNASDWSSILRLPLSTRALPWSDSCLHCQLDWEWWTDTVLSSSERTDRGEEAFPDVGGTMPWAKPKQSTMNTGQS